MKFGRSWITRATILLIVLACTLATQNYVVANFPTVGRWINNRVRGFALSAARGFDDTARLGSIRGVWMSESGQQVMLRVWSDQLPGYLRGALFDAYLQGTWAAAADSQTLEPADTHHGRNVFSFTARQPDRINGHVYADSSLRHVFFLPLGTHQISSFADSVNVARGWTARPNFPGASGGYGYYQPVSPMRGPTDLDLAVPPLLQSKLQSIADQIVGDTAGPAAIIKRIEQHFHQNYEYEFNMELRTNKDPVIEFLEDKDAGYCEYFASAATLLLRTQDIPARYVTGFVAHEPSLDNNYWIARNRDAHAWVEAYLPDQGWVIVEPTTPAARPQSNTSSTRAQFADWFAAQWQRLLQFITRGGLGGMIAALWDGLIVLMTQIIPLWAWGVLIAAAALWSTRSRIRKWWARKRAAPQPPHILALQRKLTLAQNLLDPHGLTLAPGDTVADYLDAAAAADIPEPARIEAVQLLTEYQHDRFHPPTDDSPPAPDIG
ncbi:MAG: hypothetical protein CMJ49_13795 [Planctomycetaceae bacterium]|nr:hypothetical protein [Planctomycetaceae bacterium]